ncbi:MAG: hypothetical protein QM676_15725, partial [Novosphingobium sp.]
PRPEPPVAFEVEPQCHARGHARTNPISNVWPAETDPSGTGMRANEACPSSAWVELLAWVEQVYCCERATAPAGCEARNVSGNARDASPHPTIGRPMPAQPGGHPVFERSSSPARAQGARKSKCSNKKLHALLSAI